MVVDWSLLPLYLTACPVLFFPLPFFLSTTFCRFGSLFESSYLCLDLFPDQKSGAMRVALGGIMGVGFVEL